MESMQPDAVWQASLAAGDESLQVSFPEGGELPYLLWETGRAGVLPSDWSGFEAFEFTAANHTERTIYLHWRFYGHHRYIKQGPPGPEECFTMLSGILPGITATVALPLACFDAETRYPLRPPGAGVIYTWGRAIDIRSITAVRLLIQALEQPFEITLSGPRLQTGPLSCQPPLGGPVVDRFGQWNRKDWPGKIHNEDELAGRMRAEDMELAKSPRPSGRGTYGGYTAKRFAPSGFFRLEREEGGRWWLVDPEGYAFFSTGLDCVQPRAEGPIAEGHRALFEEPPATPENEALSPYSENLKRVHGSAWRESWAVRTTLRHRAWGFNTIGNWSDPDLTRRGELPYVMPLKPLLVKPLWRDFPDISAPDFPRACAEFGSQVLDRRNDPMLIGYFLGNEPAWSRDAILAERILAGPDSHSRKQLLERLRQAGYGSIVTVNADWATAFADWEDIGRVPWPNGRLPAPAARLLREYSGELVKYYYTSLIGALREADPNHLILGIRFAGVPKEDYCLKGMELSDLVSINVYAHEPPDELRQIHELTGRPILIGEFHFGALGYGSIAHGLCGVATDRDKGVAFRYFLEKLAAMPFTVGAHWFQYIDEPCFGRFDGENYACGFVDVTDRPYPELVEAARTVNACLFDVLTGRRTPAEEKPAPAKTGIWFG